MKKFFIKDIVVGLGLLNYEIVGYRPFGEKVKNSILKEIESTGYPKVIVLDFDGIRSSDVSFVDEVVFETLEYIKILKIETVFLLANVEIDITNTIKATQSFRKDMSVDKDRKIYYPLLLQNLKIEIIGDIEKNLIETFNFIKTNSGISARDIADQFNIAINSASNRLKKLYDYKLIRREEKIDESGKYYLYLIPQV